MPDKALESDLPTVRVTLTDATVEHGRLLVISGSHRHRGVTPIRHVIDAPGESNTIPASELAPGSRVPLPVRRGGLVLFDRLTRHASLPNRSDGIRMCVDQRCQPAGLSFPCREELGVTRFGLAGCEGMGRSVGGRPGGDLQLRL